MDPDEKRSFGAPLRTDRNGESSEVCYSKLRNLVKNYSLLKNYRTNIPEIEQGVQREITDDAEMFP